ncbi:MAG: hypothetical protein H6581_30275 [Bacteroidia bacterium]|nr:hypothetical protein [Bacteroidia bacterium]
MNSFSQGNNVNAGKKALEMGDHKSAIQEFDAALADPTQLKGKVLAETYLNRAKAKLGYLNRVMRNEGFTAENRQRMQDYGLSLYPDLKLALSSDNSGKLEPEIKTETGRAQEILSELSDKSLVDARRKDLSEEEKKAIYQNVINYCDASLDIEQNNYLPYSMKGECLLALGNPAEALKNFHSADESFFRSAPKRGDLNIALIYQHIAELERDLNQNIKGAQDAVKEGIDRLSGEMAKIDRLPDLRPNVKASFQIRYEELRHELEKLQASLANPGGK